ncbi:MULTISPECIES: WHG domain-containing protein [Streptomycetaceae]|uniref:TetR/AcrR family transcriptional regulator n=1 Tax=Embleya scabrispora TaxID=159449 RepID=UPI0003778AC1
MGVSKERYHHGELRAALLDAAELLVRERGVDGWSLREVSARVGVSPSAAYHHFDSRDALVRTLSERVIARLGERLRRAAHRASGDHRHRRLIAYGRSYVRWALEDPAVARLAFAAGRTDLRTPISPHPHDVLAAELDRLVDTGELPSAARPGAEFVVWAAVHGLATLLTDGLVHLDGPRAVDREAERLIDAVLTGLTREQPPAHPWPTPRSAHSQRLTDHPPVAPASKSSQAPA